MAMALLAALCAVGVLPASRSTAGPPHLELQLQLDPPALAHVAVNASVAAHAVADGGEAGLMEDLGCIQGYVQGAASTSNCPFGLPWFTRRLAQLGAGGGQSMRLGGGMQACVVYNVTGALARVPIEAHVNKAYCGARGMVSTAANPTPRPLPHATVPCAARCLVLRREWH